MKIGEIPQDQDPALDGGKKVCYAVDEYGKIKMAQSSGWKVEETVKDLAWKEIENDLEQTLAKIKRGQLSALCYFMKLRQMDPQLLAQNMGISVWRVRWHLRPKVFRRMSEAWLLRYSECLDIPIKTLRKGVEEVGVDRGALS
jgi:hypothetical protein